MNEAERLEATEKLLRMRGWDAESAKETAQNAVEDGEPLLESLCFQGLAEHVLAKIHTSSWISNRANNPSCDEHEIIKRLVESGASVDDLAIFARVMQREYLSNLGCILDGAGICGTPDLPCEDFRVFAVDDSENPQARLEELHESLGWIDLETEMRLSRDAQEHGG